MAAHSAADLLGHRLAVLEALARPQPCAKPLVERIAAVQARLDAVEQQIPEARMIKDSLRRLPLNASKLRMSHEAVMAKLVVVLDLNDQVNAMSTQLAAVKELEQHLDAEHYADLESWKAQAIRLEAKYARLVAQVRTQTEKVDQLLQVHEEAITHLSERCASWDDALSARGC